MADSVAQIIYKQIQSLDPMFFMAVAAKQYLATKTGLRFKVGRNPKLSHVIVSIDLNGKDYYDVTFGRVRKSQYKIINRVTDIGWEQLADILNGEIG